MSAWNGNYDTDVTFKNGTTFDLKASNTLTGTGDITFEEGSVIQLAPFGENPDADITYRLVSTTGTITYANAADWNAILQRANYDIWHWSLEGDEHSITLSYRVVDPNSVPEPATWLLLLLGLFVCAGRKILVRPMSRE